MSLNPTTTSVVPIVALTVDADFDRWYVGGGIGAHVSVDPAFPGSDLLGNGAFDISTSPTTSTCSSPRG